MLLAEEYLLLARKEDTGKLLVSVQHLRLAVSGASGVHRIPRAGCPRCHRGLCRSGGRRGLRGVPLTPGGQKGGWF